MQNTQKHRQNTLLKALKHKRFTELVVEIIADFLDCVSVVLEVTLAG